MATSRPITWNQLTLRESGSSDRCGRTNPAAAFETCIGCAATLVDVSSTSCYAHDMVASNDQAERIVKTMRTAAARNFDSPGRTGCVVELGTENGDDVLVAADLHGNRINYEKLLAKADLSNNPRRHLIMQEVCHGGPTYPTGGCMSHLLLEDAAQLKIDFPDRFHFVLSNHELSELTDFAIMKSGKMLNLSFREGIQQMYGARSDDVREAYLEFLASCPLAVRLSSDVLICHSIPEKVDRDGFDLDILGRNLEQQDFRPRGPVFRLVWGRDFREENAAAFAKLTDAKVLIHGHEPCVDGFQIPNTKQVILDCCSTEACYVILPTHGKITQQQVIACISKLASCTQSQHE